jgi:hypothetical protein
VILFNLYEALPLKSNLQRRKVFVSLVLSTRITVFALLCVSRPTRVSTRGCSDSVTSVFILQLRSRERDINVERSGVKLYVSNRLSATLRTVYGLVG